MIDIQVSGGTKRQRELCKSIAEFSIAKLMPRKRNLDIDIQLNKTDGALGYCLWINRNEYSVEIDKRQGLRRSVRLLHMKWCMLNSIVVVNCLKYVHNAIAGKTLLLKVMLIIMICPGRLKHMDVKWDCLYVGVKLQALLTVIGLRI